MASCLGTSYRWCSKNIGFPALFIFSCAVTALGELYFAQTECSAIEVLDKDAQWLIRTAMMFVLPLSFALTIDAWSLFGNPLKLTFRHNERPEPLCCRCEAMIPALLVGEGIAFIIPPFCWGECAPSLAIGSYVIGSMFVLSGFGLSIYIRRPEWICGRRRDSAEDTTLEITKCSKEKEGQDVESSIRDLPPIPSMDTERKNTLDSSESPNPLPRGTPLTKSLGAFDIPDTA